MRDASEFFRHRHMHAQAIRVQHIISGFEKYLHYEGTEDLLTVLGELAGDFT